MLHRREWRRRPVATEYQRGAGIPQPRDKDGRPDGSHPHFRPHLMQGWTPDFIPRLTEDAVAMNLIDEILPIDEAVDVGDGGTTGPVTVSAAPSPGEIHTVGEIAGTAAQRVIAVTAADDVVAVLAPDPA